MKEADNRLCREQRFDKARDQYDEAIFAEPNDFIYYKNKCAAQLKQQKYTGCEHITEQDLHEKEAMNLVDADDVS